MPRLGGGELSVHRPLQLPKKVQSIELKGLIAREHQGLGNFSLGRPETPPVTLRPIVD